MLTPMLQLHSVSLSKSGTRILEDINATVMPSDVIIITGPSGGGKSMLLRLLNRLEEPTAGQILFHDKNIRDIHPVELRRKIGMVFQTPVMFPGSVLENFHRVERINNRPVQPTEVYAELMKQAGLSLALMSQEATTLSLGQKQRLSVARALVNKPQILLLDEPTSALDPDSARHLMETLETLHTCCGLTMLMVTHHAEYTEHIGSQRWVMRNGRLVEDRRLVPTIQNGDITE